MTGHISDELPRLLTGDAPRDVVLEAAAHLRHCADCQQDLVSAVVAHASLTSAHRFAPEIVAPGEHDAKVEDVAPVADLPDLSHMFSQVREEARGPVERERPRRRRVLVAVAAAAVIAGGGATAIAVATSGTDQPNSRQVALAAYDEGQHTAKVTIVGDNRLKVDATALPKLDSTHQYEVWLTDTNRTRMQSVGYIGNDNTADLKVPSKVISQYNDVEVSIQKIDQDQYSGNSVLRGSYG